MGPCPRIPRWYSGSREAAGKGPSPSSSGTAGQVPPSSTVGDHVGYESWLGRERLVSLDRRVMPAERRVVNEYGIRIRNPCIVTPYDVSRIRVRNHRSDGESYRSSQAGKAAWRSAHRRHRPRTGHPHHRPALRRHRTPELRSIPGLPRKGTPETAPSRCLTESPLPAMRQEHEDPARTALPPVFVRLPKGQLPQAPAEMVSRSRPGGSIRTTPLPRQRRPDADTTPNVLGPMPSASTSPAAAAAPCGGLAGSDAGRAHLEAGHLADRGLSYDSFRYIVETSRWINDGME